MYAYLVVEIDGAKLFIDDTKINSGVMHYLNNAGIELRPYESILSEIERLVFSCVLLVYASLCFACICFVLLHVALLTFSSINLL